MSRTAQIYASIHTRSDGVRERVELMPAANTITSATTFPKYSLMQISGGGTAFDKYPSGLIKNDERTLKFHLDYMYASDPVLTDYILAPVYEEFVNVWTISDDGGDSELAVSEFPVRFRGIQIAQPSDELDEQLTGTEYAVKILHVARYLAEQSVPADIADAIIAQADENFLFNTVMASNLWDVIYTQEDGSRVAVMDSGRYFNDIGIGKYNHRAAMFKFVSLFAAVQRWMQARYAVITHTEMNEVRWKDGGIPSDPCIFYAPDVVSGGGIGTFVTVDLADADYDPDRSNMFYDESQLWFAGLVFEFGHTNLFDVVYDPYGNPQFDYSEYPGAYKIVGGYLYEPDMFRSYKTVHDWLMDIASNLMCKLTYSLTATGIVEFSANLLMDDEPTVLDKSTFIREAKPLKRNESAMRGCDAEVVGAGESDISQIEYYKDGTSENRQDGNIKCLFHNCPSAAGIPDENIFYGDTFLPWYVPELKYPFDGSSIKKTYIFKRDGFRSNVLYCDISNAVIFKAQYGRQFVRASECLVMNSGADLYDRPHGVVGLPEIGLTSASIAARLMQGWAVGIQKTDCLPYAVCLANTEMFSQTMTYSGTADYGVISPSDAGKTYDMSEFIHPALVGKTPQFAILKKVVEKRDENNNLLPCEVEFFGFEG